MLTRQRGFILPLAVFALLLLLLILPALLHLSKSESTMTVKSVKGVRGLHLAESGIERGVRHLLVSTSAWQDVLDGQALPGFAFDENYVDLADGTYKILLASTSAGSVTVTSVGLATGSSETRAIRVAFRRGHQVSRVLFSAGQIESQASTTMEWGPAASRTVLKTGGAAHPRFYCTGAIDPLDTSASAPNSDGFSWWSYDTTLPSLPAVDLDFYRQVAQAAGAAPAGCGSFYYINGNATFKSCNQGIVPPVPAMGTWYVTGDLTFAHGGSGNYLKGTLIVLGNLHFNGAAGAYADVSVPVPPKAWVEYGRDWAFYKSKFDPAAPATYAAAVTNGYSASSAFTIQNLVIDGFIYVGKDLQLNTSGYSSIRGAILTKKQAELGGNFTLYFDSSMNAIQTADQSITQTSWEEVACGWTDAACP